VKSPQGFATISRQLEWQLRDVFLKSYDIKAVLQLAWERL